MLNLIQDRVRKRERWVRGTQTIGGGCRRGGVAGGCHGVDGVEDGGEEVPVGEARIRWRPWPARVPVPFGPVPVLAGNRVGAGERRGDAGEASRHPRASRDRIEMWEGFVAATNLG